MINKIEEIRSFVEELFDEHKGLNNQQDVGAIWVLGKVLARIDKVQNGAPQFVICYESDNNKQECYYENRSVADTYYHQMKNIAENVKLFLEVDGVRVLMLEGE